MYTWHFYYKSVLQYKRNEKEGNVCYIIELEFNLVNRKTNLDNILKSRDITLMTKVHIVKVMAFPLAM